MDFPHGTVTIICQEKWYRSSLKLTRTTTPRPRQLQPALQATPPFHPLGTMSLAILLPISLQPARATTIKALAAKAVCRSGHLVV